MAFRIPPTTTGSTSSSSADQLAGEAAAATTDETGEAGSTGAAETDGADPTGAATTNQTDGTGEAGPATSDSFSPFSQEKIPSPHQSPLAERFGAAPSIAAPPNPKDTIPPQDRPSPLVATMRATEALKALSYSSEPLEIILPRIIENLGRFIDAENFFCDEQKTNLQRLLNTIRENLAALEINANKKDEIVNNAKVKLVRLYSASVLILPRMVETQEVAIDLASTTANALTNILEKESWGNTNPFLILIDLLKTLKELSTLRLELSTITGRTYCALDGLNKTIGATLKAIENHIGNKRQEELEVLLRTILASANEMGIEANTRDRLRSLCDQFKPEPTQDLLQKIKNIFQEERIDGKIAKAKQKADEAEKERARGALRELQTLLALLNKEVLSRENLKTQKLEEETKLNSLSPDDWNFLRELVWARFLQAPKTLILLADALDPTPKLITPYRGGGEQVKRSQRDEADTALSELVLLAQLALSVKFNGQSLLPPDSELIAQILDWRFSAKISKENNANELNTSLQELQDSSRVRLKDILENKTEKWTQNYFSLFCQYIRLLDSARQFYSRTNETDAAKTAARELVELFNQIPEEINNDNSFKYLLNIDRGSILKPATELISSKS